MDPIHKKQHPKSSSSSTIIAHQTTRPDPTTKHFSSLNTNHRVRKSPKETLVDTHLQAKAMSLSTIAERSQYKLTTSAAAAAAAAAGKEKSRRRSKDKDEKELPQATAKEVLDIQRISSGAIVKIKEMNESFEELDLKRPSFSLGRRRSFCGSQVELADFLSGNGARIVSVDMPPFMQIHAVDCARKAHDSLEKFTSRALACTLKKEFDGVYGPAWHCIVGTSFGSFVTHSVGGFLYFSMDHKLYILLFKTTVQRAD
ncbi:hypothetical protein L1049_027656 [Liquidambar formosana]|uniref:Dynein light chain n=1 Tax=Liquidambar formosana TaxID=63359 RepID=A0AAP0RJ51_LIQFO